MIGLGRGTLRLRRVFRRFREDETGVVSMEFILWFPLFFTLFLSSVESGFLTAKMIMLERGLDTAIREVRLGASMTHVQLRDKICAGAIILDSCQSNLRIEMVRVETSGTPWTGLGATARCVSDADYIDPNVNPPGYGTSSPNDIMMVRACALVSPIFPSSSLGLRLPKDASTQKYRLISISGFVREPSGG